MAQTKLKGKQVETFTDTTEGVVPASGGGTTNFLRADGTWATSTTSNVSEGSNLYFTTARVLGTVLSGLSLATGGAIVSTDSILVAFGKIQNQINNLVTLNTTQTITGNKQFDDVRLIKKVNTGTYPTTSGGYFTIGGNGSYDNFLFYSFDGLDSDGFGTSKIYSNPEEGNKITHSSLDNQQSSIVEVNKIDLHFRNIIDGERTSLYVNGVTDKIIIEGTQNKFAALGTSLITGTKNFEFPNKNGILALLSDIIESAENKLDKVTSSGVERAYIVNADGSQGTKATSEFGGGGSGLTFQEVLRMKTILNNL